MRAPYQVLVLPYIIEDGLIEFAIFNRSDFDYWQGIAGGGEGQETPIEAAKRELFEETGILGNVSFRQLDSIFSLSVESVVGKFLWGEHIYVIKEYCFGAQVFAKDITLSKEHLHYKWLSFEEAVKHLKWDSNKTALWELNKRLLKEIS
ncbi:cytochrome C biogenesis protein CcdA [Bacillus sp. FJAT-21351]|nr:cytochrome C biogenesis protein CcdA [Bacillus sp. FJAT-21351]